MGNFRSCLEPALGDKQAPLKRDHRDFQIGSAHMPMYQTIIIAYDGTAVGDAALHEAARLARLCEARLHILAIVVTTGGLLLDPATVSIDLLESERQCLDQALDKAAQRLARQGLIATTCIRDGDPAVEIVAYAHEIKADLVVTGHNHKGMLARWFEGSVATRLADTMPCSMLIVIDTTHLP
jgi:nucleotide-binding universal stress UspA family protein